MAPQRVICYRRHLGGVFCLTQAHVATGSDGASHHIRWRRPGGVLVILGPILPDAHAELSKVPIQFFVQGRMVSIFFAKKKTKLQRSKLSSFFGSVFPGPAGAVS